MAIKKINRKQTRKLDTIGGMGDTTCEQTDHNVRKNSNNRFGTKPPGTDIVKAHVERR